MEPVSGYPAEELPPLEKYSPEYRETRRKLILSIMRTPGFDIKNIDRATITAEGMLNTYSKDDTLLTSTNLIEGWNNILLPRPRTDIIRTETRKGLESLEKEVNTESLFDGSIILTYLPVTITTAVSVHSLWTLSTWIKRWGEFIISKVTIRNMTTGKMETIPLSEIYKWTKESIRSSLIKILEKHGYIHSPAEKWFFSPEERALQETKKSLGKMSYDEFRRQQPGTALSKSEFDQAKELLLTKMESLPAGKSWGARVDALIKILGRNIGELIFFPVFFSHFSKYQDTSTFLQWASEIALFTTGNKLVTGTRIGAKLPIPFYMKPIAGMAMWGAFVLGGKEAATLLEMNRKKWQYMFDDGLGSLYSDGKSTSWHLAANLGVFNIAEYLDLFNKWWQKLADLAGSKSEDLDIGIPRIEMPTPFGKYMGRIPEMNLFQSTVNLGTNPWDWMRSAMGRDVDDWNKKVLLYEEKLQRVVEDIVRKYLRNESMFGSTEKIRESGGKENLLKIELLDILSAWGAGSAFDGEKGRLIEGITAYAQSLDKNRPNFATIHEIIRNRTRQMIIDDFFIESRSQASLKRVESFPAFIPMITTDPKKQTYIQTLLDRMIQGKPIVAGGKWEKTEVLGMSSNKWIASEENILFQGLLGDTNIVEVTFPGFRGKTTVGNAFSLYLEMILEHKREQEFLTEIKKWNKKWVVWTR
jgi:hypothetical protein